MNTHTRFTDILHAFSLRTFTENAWRTTRGVAVGCGLAISMAGCTLPTESAVQEVEAETKASKVDQIMRVADATRAGGDMKSALTLYKRAHVMDPTSVAPLMGAGDTALAMGAHQDALQAFARAVKLDPDNSQARHGYGRVLIGMNRPKDALGQFRKAIELDQRNHRAFNGMGVAMDLLGRHGEAQQNYISGMEIAPDNPSLRNNLALSIALEEDYDESIAMLTALSDGPVSTSRHVLNLALVYGLSGDMDQAAAVARRVLPEEKVQDNLAYYAVMKAMPPAERAAAIFGIRGPGAAGAN